MYNVSVVGEERVDVNIKNPIQAIARMAMINSIKPNLILIKLCSELINSLPFATFKILKYKSS